MDPEIIFSICSVAVFPAWLLLIFLPKWKWTTNIVQYAWIPAILSACYVALFFLSPASNDGGGMDSLESVVILLSSPYSALAAWLHFLAFDLFVGAWIVRDSTKLSLHPALVAPCLVLTFAYGPAGFLCYFLLRLAIRKTFAYNEQLVVSQ